MSTPLWVTTTRGDLVGAATIEADDEVITEAAHGLVNGQQVTVANLGGGALNVLVEDAPYFVANATANTFQLRPAPGAPIMTFTADGSCDVYLTAGLNEAQTLRNAFAGLLARGDGSGGFNARPGVFPNASDTAHVTTSGMTWSTIDMVAVVRHSTGGIYIVPHPAETSQPITAADPSQGRIDALDLQIQDHALDSSGFARGRLVYVAGTPAAVPVEPAVTANSERLSTWTVAAGATSTGTPTTPRFTVARGGVIPVASSAAYPGAGGRYKGLILYDFALKALVANTNAGSTYEVLASVDTAKALRRIATVERTTNSSTFTSEAVISTITAAVESGKKYKITWVVDSSSTVAGDTARWRIRETNIAGATRQLSHSYMSIANNDFGAPPLTFEWTASSTGNMTWVGTCHRANGTGTFSCNANANEPSYFTVDYVSG
jgi:hypothetical protein